MRLEVIDQALRRSARSGERWYDAELLRIKGEFHLKDMEERGITEAENCLSCSINLAKDQGALCSELKSALSLFQLAAKAATPGGGTAILAPRIRSFTEGLDGADLQAARGVLGSR